MSIQKLTVAMLAVSVGSLWAADVASGAFTLKGDVQTHLEKRLWDEGKDNLLDKYYMRANFGGKYTAEDVTGEFNIRLFVPNFGNVTIDDSKTTIKSNKINGDSSITTKKIDNVVLEKAVIELKPFKGFSVKVGHWSTDYSMSGLLGNYIDQDVDPTKLFLSRTYYHDAVEFVYKLNMFTTSVLVGGTDKSLNTGYMRVVETVKIPALKLVADAGWRGNILDSLSFPDASPAHYNRFFLRLQDTIITGSGNLVPYAEIAMVDKLSSSGVLLEKQQGVGNIGVKITPPGLKNTQINLEGEFEKDREVNGKDRSIDWNIALTQKCGKRAKLQLYAFSDPTGEKASNVEIGSRLTLSVE